jgi:phospholipid/cholesterol/gamma-HCH transport system permease protein
MSVLTEGSRATVSIEPLGEGLSVALSGAWRITAKLPRWEPKLSAKPASVTLHADAVTVWDSSLALYIDSVRRWCALHKIPYDQGPLPQALQALLSQLDPASRTGSMANRAPSILSAVGIEAQHIWRQAIEISHFVGECVLSARRLIRNPARFRWRDCLEEMQQCGAMALPIVGLVSFLVGVTLAYTGAIILRLFGGDIWVADLIGLSVTREMGAVMTGVVLAGRTGAAYAAHIGNMKANEEIDALEILGVSPIDFLVVPRLVALSIMTPLLSLYANCLGILGGMLIAQSTLSIPPTAYWIEMLAIVDLSDVGTGLIKASTFGLIVGTSGCLRGLQAERSAAGVGRAATSSVVTAILLMVVADSLFAVIFNILGW